MLLPMISLPSPYRVLWGGGLRGHWENYMGRKASASMKDTAGTLPCAWGKLREAAIETGFLTSRQWRGPAVQRPCSSRGKVSVISTTGVSLGWSNQMVHPRGILCSDNWSQCPNSIKDSDLNETCFLYSSICILSLRDPMTSISICSNNSGFSPVTCNEQLLHL